jgi:DNA-binding CsgD family transcriptional regulator
MPSKLRSLNKVRHVQFNLTPDENAEVALVVAGYSDKESAARMGIGCATFCSHLEGIFKKLKVSDRFELVLFALYYDLASVDSIPQIKVRKPSRRLTHARSPGA